MGEVVARVEEAQAVVDQEKGLKFQEKARKATGDLEDFLSQMEEVKKMGSIGDLIKKIPGMSQLAGGELGLDDGELGHIEAIIYSMTPGERQKPKMIKASRRRRIADGSGMAISDVNRLLKDFEKTKKMMKQMMRGGKRRGMRARGGMPSLPGL